MTRKKLIKKNNILKLKYVYEENQVAEEENQIGLLELKDLLKDFSERVNPDQKSHFNEMFLGEKTSQDQKLSDTTDIVVASQKAAKEKDIKDSSLPKWVKNLYKKIVQRSHPDKYIGFPIQEIKEKFKNVYINAVTAFGNQDIGMILLCAYDVEIDISQFHESEKFINNSIIAHQQKTNEIKNSIGYQWYHLVDSNRKPFLESYLNRLGYLFDVKKAEEVVQRVKNRRKSGVRPEKLRVKRSKIK